ncbi:hypothetical protein EUTSA_v10003384mg [Eutrema salsugineum]|uniref:TF-B3 domain-containing protein n=1 Tax=Eutrema salsugineum TaxID=72664 RepID=V4LQF6_EUTSA|nr:hypothetical protein EUTSA_v10003384mg [Eutrema salsugineum]
MLTIDLLSDEEDFEAVVTLFQYRQARGDFFENRRTSLTTEEEREAEHEAALGLIELRKTRAKQQNKKRKANKSQPEEVKLDGQADDEETQKLESKQQNNKKKANKSQPEEVELDGQVIDEETQKLEQDNSDDTLKFLSQRNKTKPEKLLFVDVDVVGVRSDSTRKQLNVSDVKVGQIRLLLGKKHVKKMMLQVIGNSKIIIGLGGIEVSLYRPRSHVFKMLFKMWGGGTPVLSSPKWNKFVEYYKIKLHCDFVTIWMFRHKETRQICFAVDFIRFP